MSEVNQAFLRAYLKNRANESIPTSAAPSTVDARGHQNPVANRPSAAAPRQMPSPPTQPPQSLPSGMSLRFDPAHGDQHNQSVPQVAAIPFASQPLVQPNQDRVAPRQGVWSPVGAERGMKALERQSSPAVVRNGVTPITQEATQFRRPTPPASAAIPQASVPTAHPAAVSARSQASPPANVPPVGIRTPNSSYDQVMYVDGLVGHTSSQRAPGTRPSERTLAEITEPIAFGTGTPTELPPVHREPPAQMPSMRTQTKELHTRPAAPTAPNAMDAIPEVGIPISRVRSQIANEATTNEAVVTRRFDASHQRTIDRTPTLAPATPAPTVARAPSSSQAPTAAHADATVQRPEIASAPKPKAPAVPAPLPLPVAFSPSWEVDQFFWPEVVKQIEASHADAFQQIGKHLSLANRDGLKVMMITSGERGVGRSTVAMHMARCAASAGLRVALLDGDTFCPSLIDQLRLDMQQGWQDCLFENVPLHDIAIHSIADNITLFPLTSVISQQQVHANLHRMVKLVRRISNAFDMVFIDGSRLNLEQRHLVGVGQESVVDAAIVVTDTELSIKEKVDTAVSLLQGMGISSVGLVENFQS